MSSPIKRNERWKKDLLVGSLGQDDEIGGVFGHATKTA
jgi:hypothetical protein